MGAGFGLDRFSLQEARSLCCGSLPGAQFWRGSACPWGEHWVVRGHGGSPRWGLSPNLPGSHLVDGEQAAAQLRGSAHVGRWQSALPPVLSRRENLSPRIGTCVWGHVLRLRSPLLPKVRGAGNCPPMAQGFVVLTAQETQAGSSPSPTWQVPPPSIPPYTLLASWALTLSRVLDPKVQGRPGLLGE